MRVFERQADRHAAEEGRAVALENMAEQIWRDSREDMAERLAAGEALKVNGITVLDESNISDHLFNPDNATETSKAMALCAVNHAVGGKHIKRLMERSALELVDAYEDDFKRDIQNDLEQGEAA